MRIVFAGTPEVALPSLHALVSGGHEVVGVLTREDALLGRKRVLTPSPVAAAAEELGLPVFKANRLGDEATAWVQGLDAELGVIVAYGGLLREPLLSTPTHGWVNVHFSDLPRWRGAAPVQRALIAGETRIGATVFRLVEALDAGDVVARGFADFLLGVPAGSVLQAMATVGAATLDRAVQLIGDHPEIGEPQLGETTYAHKLTREDGKLDLARSADEVLAHWAGVTPEPGAWVLFDDAPLKLHDLRPTTAQPGLDEIPTGDPRPAGRVTLVDGRAILHLGDGALHLERVQPAGKQAMDGAAWLRGRSAEAVLS